MIDKKYIVNIKGKDTITYNGLRKMAHQKGLQSINTQVLSLPEKENNFTTIVKATVTMKDKSIFENIGDANPNNVNKMIAPHSVRMASTKSPPLSVGDVSTARNVLGRTVISELKF